MYIHCCGILKIALKISLSHLIWLFPLCDSQYFKQSIYVILQHLLPVRILLKFTGQAVYKLPGFCLLSEDERLPFTGILNGFSTVFVLVSCKMSWLRWLLLRVSSFYILGKWCENHCGHFPLKYLVLPVG